MRNKLLPYLFAGLGLIVLAASLGLVLLMYAAHQNWLAAITLTVIAVGVWIYVTPKLYAWRYMVPGLFAALMFIVIPMCYTFGIGFTNYSAAHLLSFERATEVLLGKMTGKGNSLAVQIEAKDALYRLRLFADNGDAYTSEFVKLGGRLRLPLAPATDAPGTALTLKEITARLDAIKQVVAVLPDGTELRAVGLRRFAAMQPTYRMQDGELVDTNDGSVLKADKKDGFWKRADGTPVEPGFRTNVGWQNYVQIFTDDTFRAPFLRVFTWTVAFAGLNTVLTFGIGVLLAVALNWDALRYRNFYRVMLFLPYAVPVFISVPVFRGLFNENLGEINTILDLLFGIRPSWFSDATLARSMVLIVNTWLAYPYMMILSMGLIKAIPSDLYEASSVAGAGPLTNFFSITLPLIAKPIAPLLIASFATNFNNLTLIVLLTNGAPDFLDTQVPVGATDLLASYTYRIAFQYSGQNYALACAISSIVFLIVATLAVINLRLFKVGRESE